MNNLAWRLLGTAAALAAGAAVGAAAAKLWKKQGVTQEVAELATERADLSESIYTAPEAVQQAAEQLQAQTPAAQPLPPVEKGPDRYEAGGPNVNPVLKGAPTAPKDENGKFDPTQIATADDFCDWEELGCQG